MSEALNAAPPLHALRAALEDVIARAIGALDALDVDPDLEPSLAGFNPLGSFDDREADDGGTYADEEPGLRALGGTARSGGSQLGWAGGTTSDLEDEHDGREPQCEDEGAQCEDEGAPSGDLEPWLGALERSQHYTSGSEDLELDRSPVDPDDDPGEFVARCEVLSTKTLGQVGR